MPKLIDPPADWKNLTAHPVAALFPPAVDDEYKTLRQDILERGQQEPILLYEKHILDGKARHRACKEVDIVPTFAEWEGDQTTLAVWLQAKGANLARRHLTAEQRAAVLFRAADTASTGGRSRTPRWRRRSRTPATSACSPTIGRAKPTGRRS